MSDATDLSSISITDLDEVTGGATPPATTQSSTNPQLSAALQGITSSIANLSKNNSNSGGSSIAQLLPFMLMARGGSGGGACPCGCGMANCMRR